MAKHRAKYRLICSAPDELTQYNKDWNKKVEAECNREPKFEPHLSCVKCKYCKTTRLK